MSVCIYVCMRIYVRAFVGVTYSCLQELTSVEWLPKSMKIHNYRVFIVYLLRLIHKHHLHLMLSLPNEVKS